MPTPELSIWGSVEASLQALSVLIPFGQLTQHTRDKKLRNSTCERTDVSGAAAYIHICFGWAGAGVGVAFVPELSGGGKPTSMI